MVNPSELIDALVSKLRDIPDLVGEVGGDEERIFAYHDQYPARSRLQDAIYAQPSPSVMAVWQGSDQGSRGDFGAWQHHVSLYLRAKEEYAEPPDGYYRLYRLICEGVPAGGDGQTMINTTVHDSCDPLREVPRIARQLDGPFDYFEIQMSFIEK